MLCVSRLEVLKCVITVNLSNLKKWTKFKCKIYNEQSISENSKIFNCSFTSCEFKINFKELKPIHLYENYHRHIFGHENEECLPTCCAPYFDITKKFAIEVFLTQFLSEFLATTKIYVEKYPVKKVPSQLYKM